MASAAKAGVIRRQAKRYEVVPNCAIAAACERFLQSRGIPPAQRENFNRWHTTEQPRTDHEGDQWKE